MKKTEPTSNPRTYADGTPVADVAPLPRGTPIIGHGISTTSDAAAEGLVSALRARIADLEAQLEAVGAGGVQRMVTTFPADEPAEGRETMGQFSERMREIERILGELFDKQTPEDRFKVAAEQFVMALLRVESISDHLKDPPKGVCIAGVKHSGAEYDIWVKKVRQLTGELLTASHVPEPINFASDMRYELPKPSFRADTATGAPATDPADFPLGKACDLSGEGDCEACQ